MGNKGLREANKNKENEFYTQLSDIEIELKHYKDKFKNKVVFCNCDDPYESNFFKYFAMNFNFLGLKKLIATCYSTSPIVYTQLNLFGEEVVVGEEKIKNKPYKVEITEVKDYNNDGATDLSDVEYLLKNEKNTKSLLKGNGDFRSEECIELLKQSDIVVTNPPFSLFREYIAQLIEYKKKFIVIGNTNALTYKEVFTLFKKDKVRTGYTNFNKGMYFFVPDDTVKYHKMINNKKAIRVSTSCWYTNLPVKKHKEKIILYKKYTAEEYPKLDNYDAINVDCYKDIPCDYFDTMAVPITFLDKFNPEQFELVSIAKTPVGNDFRTKIYPVQLEHNQKKGIVKEVKKLNDGPALLVKDIPLKNTYYTIGENIYISLYARVLIRRKDI